MNQRHERATGFAVLTTFTIILAFIALCGSGTAAVDTANAQVVWSPASVTGRWSSGDCRVKYYDYSVQGIEARFRDQNGAVDVERITAMRSDGFSAVTVASSSSSAVGTRWTYTFSGNRVVIQQMDTGRRFVQTRCPPTTTTDSASAGGSDNRGKDATKRERFAGERLLPRGAANPLELAKTLYGNRLVVANDTVCGRSLCTVRLLDNQIFKDQDGGEHAILVTAAEPLPSNASHASAALVGMAWLTRASQGWVLDLGSPSVTTDGANGKAPEVAIIDAGVWGKGVVLQKADMHQGVGERYWQIFVPDKNRGTFIPGLSLQTELDSSGACIDDPPTAACLKDDFSTRVTLYAEPDGLRVVATISYPSLLNRPDRSETYHVTAAGPQAAATTAPARASPDSASGATAVSERHGNIYYTGKDGIEHQLTDQHSDGEPVLSADGRSIAFIRLDKTSVDAEGRESTILCLADGFDRSIHELIRSHASAALQPELQPFHQPVFSLDGQFVYILEDHWATSRAVHQVTIRTGSERLVVDGNSIKVIPQGPYRGDLLVERHKYYLAPKSGSYDPVDVVQADGKVLLTVPGTDIDDGVDRVTPWLQLQ